MKERITWPVIIHCKTMHDDTEPNTLPIGRIDYFHVNGKVREKIEYTSAKAFENDIRECSQYGMPMSVSIYADENGQTIPHEFLYHLATPLLGVFVIPNPYQEKAFLDVAKEYINEYYRDEFETDEGADYADLTAIPVAYTTTEDDKHEIQAYVNLIDLQIITQVDKTPVRIEQYPSPWEMTQMGLRNLAFDDLIYVPDEFYDNEE